MGKYAAARSFGSGSSSGSTTIGNVHVPNSLPPDPTDPPIGSVNTIAGGSLSGAYYYCARYYDPATGKRSAVPLVDQGGGVFTPNPLISGDGPADGVTLGTYQITTTAVSGLPSSARIKVIRTVNPDIADVTDIDDPAEWVEFTDDIVPGAVFLDDGSKTTIPVTSFDRDSESTITTPAVEVSDDSVTLYATENEPDSFPTAYNAIQFYDDGTDLRLKYTPKSRAQVDIPLKALGLSDLTGTSISSPSHNDVLRYNGTTLTNSASLTHTQGTNPVFDRSRILGRFGFDSMTGWTVDSGSTPTINTTADNYLSASGSFAIVGNSTIHKNAIWTAVDGSNASSRIRLRWKVATGAVPTQINITVIDSGGHTSATWGCVAKDFTVGWHEITIAPYQNGAFLDSAVTGLKIEVVGTGTIYFDEAMIYGPDPRFNSIFIFTFDDGRQTPYAYALPILEKYGWKGLFVINEGSYIHSTSGVMQDIEARGHLVGNHTANHLTWTTGTLTSTTKRYEIERMHGILEKANMRGRRFLVMPGNNITGFDTDDAAMCLEYVDCMMSYASAIHPHYPATPSTGVPINVPHQVKGIFRHGGFVNKWANAALDAPIASKQLIIATQHDIEVSGIDFTRAEFDTFCAYLKTKEDAGLVKVMGMDEYFNLINPQYGT